MKKKLIATILTLVIAAGGTLFYILQQNSYDMVEKTIQIETPQGALSGTLALPKGETGKLGLVLFIHGDGSINASHNDGYKPLWERLAALGYASLSLDKRGIGGSEGNWLQQSINDRVEEARQALAWAKTQPMIDDNRIGVWGASQAGWVIPKLAGKEQLAFSILVSPAINWLTQGEYNTRSQMEKDGYGKAEIESQVAYEKEVKELLLSGATYAIYAAISHKGEPMTEERWSFVQKNVRSDATLDLANFQTPVLLLLGEKDIHVNVEETEAVYRATIPSSLLSVEVFPDTEHSMLSIKTADSELRAWSLSLFQPRNITVKGYMDAIEQFLKEGL